MTHYLYGAGVIALALFTAPVGAKTITVKSPDGRNVVTLDSEKLTYSLSRNDQEMVDWYHKVMEKAAAHRLMVNLHGAYPPSGLSRTWPNYITQEGVLGAENNKWSARITATHNVTIVSARRKGDTWYVGAMTNEQGRTLKVPLNFLGKGSYSARVLQDGADANHLAIADRKVVSGNSLTLKLAPSGGAVAVIEHR